MKLEIGPPPSPNRKKYPFVGTVRYRGLVIDIENLDGSTRSGVGPNGKPWKTLFKGAHYGEIRGSKGTDGDLLDVYLKADPDPKADKAYIIHQNHPGNHPTKAGRFDEDKIALGCTSVEEAKALYLKHYDRKDYLRSVTEMPFSKFKIYMRGENKGDKVAALISKLKKKKRGAPFIRMRLKGAAMNNEKLAEAYNQGVRLALEEHGLAKEGEISLPALKKQVQGPAAGITPAMMKSPLATSFAAPKKQAPPVSRTATPTGPTKRFTAPVPKPPTVAGQ